ncbi:MAG: thioredoxin family protein [Paracoccaceae bacterium]
MKKQRKSSKKKQSNQTPAAAPKKTRRDVLRMAPVGILGAAVLGGAGYLGIGAVRAGAAEYDLDRIGTGKPAIVQIHDPQCPVCTALQKEVRKALKDMDEEGLVYLVANIRTTAGKQLAQKHRVPHVTLLLFDGDGNLQEVLRGMQNKDALFQQFQAHFKEYGASA